MVLVKLLKKVRSSSGLDYWFDLDVRENMKILKIFWAKNPFNDRHFLQLQKQNKFILNQNLK